MLQFDQPGDSQFDLDFLKAALPQFELIYRHSVPSTNDLAKQWIQEGSPRLPAIILTDEQTAGRGQGDHGWYSERGSLVFTCVFPAPSDFRLSGLLPATVAVSVCDAISAVSPVQPTIKWPNDILLESGKLAGILIESQETDRGLIAVIGVGINTNNPGIDERVSHDAGVRRRLPAISLMDILHGQSTDPGQLLASACLKIGECVNMIESRSGAILERYARLNALADRAVTVQFPGGQRVQGTCSGIGLQGQLLLKTPGASSPLNVFSGQIVEF